MKINDKHLALFASSTAQVDRQGFLSKRGELNKSFQRRWFVLKGNLLFYYDRESDLEPVGVIILEGCSIELLENTDKYAFELVFLGSGSRTYVLAAESQEDMEGWMRALACSGHDYMRCAVLELQRQLDELNAAAKAQAAIDGHAANGGTTSAVMKRVNPFDRVKEADYMEAFHDLGVSQERSGSGGARISGRTFEQMHADFGGYIQSRTLEFSMRNLRKSTEC